GVWGGRASSEGAAGLGRESVLRKVRRPGAESVLRGGTGSGRVADVEAVRGELAAQVVEKRIAGLGLAVRREHLLRVGLGVVSWLVAKCPRLVQRNPPAPGVGRHPVDDPEPGARRGQAGLEQPPGV